jgi:hypothetical protein
VRAHRIAIALLVVAALIVGVTLLLRGGGSKGPPPPAVVPHATPPATDPLAWTPARSDDAVRRATDGLAHVLYAQTVQIGGIEAAVRRTTAFRPQIVRAARAHGIDPDTLEAIVLLESAGRPDAQASDDLAGAVGLTQILAETGQHLLGMHVDLRASRRIARRIVRAARRHHDAEVARLRARRRRVDQRFDPAASLAATCRYLQIARRMLGREDLAVASYHMGIGNLQTALRRYGAGTIPYVRLYFDSTPTRHATAWRFLNGLGDDSSTYLWRVYAARRILGLAREDPAALRRRNALMTARNSAEVALHPPGRTDHFADPDALRAARDDGTIVPLPARYLAGHGIRIDRQMGELAGRVGQQPSLYRGLRREALAALAYIGSGVRSISHARTPLRLTSTVRDDRYQAVLQAVDIEAAHSYSLHTTGYTFDLARDYSSRAQAVALQFMLDRLTALNLIAWVREPGAIHVTVASDAARLEKPMGVRPG